MHCLNSLLDLASRRAISSIVLGLTLTACGGGDGGATPATDTTLQGEGAGGNGASTGAGTNTTTAGLTVTSEPCPDGYRKFDNVASSISGASISLSTGNATFGVTTPKTASAVTFLACVGQPATKLAQVGYQTLSDTYEARLTTSSAAFAASTALADLKPKLTIKFALTGLPDGISAATLVDRINVYSPDTKGVWQPLATPAIDLQTVPVGDAASTIAIVPVTSVGQYVVAYKL